jgi:adenylosuccinate lyase
LMHKKPLLLEQKFLQRIKLKQNLATLQVLPPEDIYLLASSTFALCSVVAKVANDLRHLARSEIFEVMEGMGKDQVGSSTMPQKRNPWNLEHVCSLFKVLQSKLMLFQVDMVTEHQRDLTNSASSRFYVEFFCVASLMIKRLTKVLKNLEVARPAIEENFQKAGSSVFAEAFYVLGTLNGVENAHDEVRQAARESESSGRDLLSVAKLKGLVDKKLSLKSLEDQVLLGSHQKLERILKIRKGN